MLCKHLRTGYLLEFQGTICDEDQIWVLTFDQESEEEVEGNENLVTSEQVVHMSDQRTREECTRLQHT
jgi:hypothetical protein